VLQNKELMRVNEIVISPFREIDRSTLSRRTRLYVSHDDEKLLRVSNAVLFIPARRRGERFYLHALTALQPHAFSELHAVTWM